MKHYLLPGLAAAAVIAMTAVSCNKSTDSSTTAASDEISSFEIKLSTKTVARSYAVTNPDEKYYLTLSSSVMWPEVFGSADVAPLQDSIKSYLFGGLAVETIDQTMKDYTRAVEQFGATGSYTPVDSVEQDNPEMMNCWIDLRAKMLEANEESVTYDIIKEGFTAGAHPNTSSMPFTYDLKTATVLTAANMFKPGSEAEVVKVIAEALAGQLNTTPDKLDEAGLFGPLTTIGAPYILNEAIMFRYNPYEIAPYSMGTINVEVYPYMLDQYLTPQVKALFDRYAE